MSDPYLGEIRMFAGSYAPDGWALCNGQTMPIASNDALFALIGTTYGGDGTTNFALPDLQGRIPIHTAPSFPLAAKGGSETVTLSTSQLPPHTHAANASSAAGNQSSPADTVWAQTPVDNYSADNPTAAMSSAALTSAGESQSHDNMMPTLTISFIIALQGTYPSQA